MIVRRPSPFELRRLRMIADYQFGRGVGNCLIPDDVLVGVSPSTRRIREIYTPDGGLYLVLRANDYFYTLSLQAAKRLLECTEPPRHRVVLREGVRLSVKSIECSAISLIDPGLRPGDEVVILSPGGGLIGVGRLRLPVDLVVSPGCRGEAVRVRKRVEP